MILVDTSVWIGHFRSTDSALVTLLERREVLGHPWVIAELVLGSLRRRDEVVGLLQELPKATMATDAEVLWIIENESLAGTGTGYVDAQLLAATMLTDGAALWTDDAPLADIAGNLGIAHRPARNRRGNS